MGVSVGVSGGGGNQAIRGGGEGNFSEGNIIISDHVLGGCPVGVSMIN